jgi:CubicO group peptidase (beta-lactamase class C family)
MRNVKAVGGLFALLTFVLWTPSPARAEVAPAVDPRAVDSYLREQMAARRLPGLAVAVVEGGRVVVQRGYGSGARGRPVTPQMQFFIGSCTKSFTALAVMQLAAQGRLQPEAPVRRYLPWFRVADDSSSDAITVRQLLNQTSGLSEAGDPRPNDRHTSLMESARALAGVRPTAPPGARFQYYNQNYRVLGALIEHLSGQSYGDYLRDHILTPLAMSRTTTDPGATVDLAQAHAWVFGTSLARPQRSDPGALSSGYVISTAEDMARYLLAYLDGGHAGDAIAPPDAFAQLLALPAGTSGSQAAPPPSVLQLLGSSGGVECGYAMGWLVAQAPGGRRLAFHGGSLERFRADMLLLPAEKRGFVLLANQNGVLQPLFEPDPLWAGLAKILLGTRPAPPPPLRWRVLLFVLIVATDIGIGLLRLWRLPRWREKARRQAPWRCWSLALLTTAIAGGFLVAVPALLSAVARTNVTWLGFLDFIPDVAAWLLASATLSLVRGMARVVILARFSLPPDG